MIACDPNWWTCFEGHAKQRDHAVHGKQHAGRMHRKVLPCIQATHLDMVLSLVSSKLAVLIHALSLHFEQHGLADQAALGFSLLNCCLKLHHTVLCLLAVPGASHDIAERNATKKRSHCLDTGTILDVAADVPSCKQIL